MAYLTDGSTHANGVAMEYTAAAWLANEYKNGNDVLKLGDQYDFTKLIFKQIGGTKTTSDVKVYYNNETIKTISVKRKQVKGDKISGTFDLVNTTFHIDEEDITNFEWINSIVDLAGLNEFREEVKNKKGEITELPRNHELRKQYSQKINESFVSQTEEEAKNCVKFIDSLFLKTDYLMIITTENNNIKNVYLSPTVEDDKKVFEFYDKDKKYIFESGRGKGSRVIKIEDKDGKNYDKTFRLRITLNNGLTPLLGLSQANANSYWCFKIQVDKVSNIIKKMEKFDYVKEEIEQLDFDNEKQENKGGGITK